MSRFLDSLLDRKRRAECARNDAVTSAREIRASGNHLAAQNDEAELRLLAPTKATELAFTSDCPSWIKERVTAAHADMPRIGRFLQSLPLLDGTAALLFEGHGYTIVWGVGEDEGEPDFVHVYRTSALPDGKRLLSHGPVARLVARLDRSGSED